MEKDEIKAECRNTECKSNGVEITIENPTYVQEPKHGLTMCSEQYCEECGHYMASIFGDDNPHVRLSTKKGY